MELLTVASAPKSELAESYPRRHMGKTCCFNTTKLPGLEKKLVTLIGSWYNAFTSAG